MQEYRYVIVGGGIAGTTAAETIRKRDAEGAIAIISDEPHPLYSRVLLSKPKWVLGEQPFDNVWLKNDAWYAEKNIHLFRGLTATALDADRKRVTLSDGDVLSYEKLLLATGAHSRPWTVPGAEKQGVLSLRTVDDARAIAKAAQGEPKRVVTIGSSCVSFEIIEILRTRGFTVTEVMRERYYFEPSLSRAEGELIEKVLTANEVEIIRENEVAEVLGSDSVTGVRLKDGREIPCDIVLAFIGVVYPLAWLKSAGLAVNRGILANTFLETNLPGVYSAGDTTESWDEALGEVVIMGNWMSARLQGEVAGKNMSAGPAEERTPFHQVSFHTSHGFGYQIGWVGDVRVGGDRIELHHPTPEPDSYCRLILWHGRVVGGTAVNRPDLMGMITKLIQSREDVSARLKDLGEVVTAATPLPQPTGGSCG